MHAKIAPSSLARIVACPGSLAIAEPFMNAPPTDETKEGEAAHWLALEYAEDRRHPLGTVAPNGVEIDADMIHGALIWCDTVGETGVAEVPVMIPRIHDECWGTPDRWKFVPNVLRVYDYKYGHKYVDPFENWQLIAYTAGVIDVLAGQGHREDEMRVELCIVQPRAYHKNGPVQYWRHPSGRLLFAHELRPYVNQAYMRVEEALKPFAPTRTGNHCLYCPGRHVCKTLQQAAMDAVEFLGTAQSMDLSHQALGTELAILESVETLLKARKTGLEEQAEYALRTGSSVPNYGLEPGQSRLKWKLPAGETVAMMDAFGYDVRKPQDVITPTQARDRFKIDDAVMSLYSDRPPAAMKLKRISTNEARKVFGT